jgi:hypothetical protein
MKQTPMNLLAELKELSYEEARTTNKTIPLKKGDPVTQRDIETKGRMHLIIARILSDLQYTDGKNIKNILEEAAAKEISLYRCDLAENLERIMPEP